MKYKTRVVLSLTSVSLLFVIACHKRQAIIPPTAPTTTAAPAVSNQPTCTLTAEPATVGEGQPATLSWTSENATDLVMEPGLGKEQPQGSMSVTPQESTTYTLNVTGPGGSSSCTARVTVTVPPAPPRPAVQESNIGGGSEASLRDAFFDYDRSDLRPDAQEVLTGDATYLKAHPGNYTVEGYCDQRGSEEYNLGLGDRRASAAKNFLTSLGTAAGRMSTVSYGKNRLVCNENTEDCWQKNRRVHLSPE